MSIKLYARFTADFGHAVSREFSGIVELDDRDRTIVRPSVLTTRIAQDLSLDVSAVQVLHWSRLH